MLDAGPRAEYKPSPALARALDVLFMLHAEHELNCSTSAARHLASSGVDVYTGWWEGGMRGMGRMRGEKGWMTKLVGVGGRALFPFLVIGLFSSLVFGRVGK